MSEHNSNLANVKFIQKHIGAIIAASSKGETGGLTTGCIQSYWRDTEPDDLAKSVTEYVSFVFLQDTFDGEAITRKVREIFAGKDGISVEAEPMEYFGRHICDPDLYAVQIFGNPLVIKAAIESYERGKNTMRIPLSLG
jgi:hypothetical protein